MQQLISDLVVEWLASLTEEIAKLVVNSNLKNSVKIAKLLSKYNLQNLKNDFESLYKYSYIQYSFDSDNLGLGELFALKNVVKLFETFFYNDTMELVEFENNLVEELSLNAYKKESLVKIYYSRNTINFRNEIERFCEIFYDAINKSRSPNDKLVDRMLNNILFKIDSIKELNRKSITYYKKIFTVFKEEYYLGLKKKIENINFYGIELPTVNRPREIDLESIFEEPDFHQIGYRETFWPYMVEGIYHFAGHNIFNEVHVIFSKIGSKSNFHVEDLKRPEVKEKLENLMNISYTMGPTNMGNLPLNNLFRDNNKIVLLGNAGAGKSSLIKYISLQILKNNENAIGLKSIENYIPIIVPINEYNKYKTQMKGGVLEFIFDCLKSKYQVAVEDFLFLIEMVRNEKTIVFFDGLDEVFDISERNEIKEDIDLFSKKHVNSIIIVSSRYESYQEVFFDSTFTVYGVNQFNEEKILNFVSKWFKIEHEEREENVGKFILALQNIPLELKSNPLLLTLILLIYKYEKDLPKSKLDIYESCTKTLIERRDEKEKKLDISSNIKNKLSLLSVLAFWQYKIQSKQSDEVLSHNNVKKLLISYMVDKRIIEDLAEAETNAETFLEFAKLRSIYFENNFTHKTFLEYLTAYYIYANFQIKGKLEERNEILTRNLSNSFWYIVIELFILKVDKESLDSEIIDDLMIVLLNYNEEDSLKILLPIIPNLKNIRVSIKRTLIERGINCCLEFIVDGEKGNYVLFDYLGYCLKRQDLSIIINEILEEMTAVSSNKNLSILIFELYYCSRVDIPIGLQEYLLKNSINSDYSWILFNNMNLRKDWDSYFKLMGEFQKLFPKNDLYESYESVFHVPLFFNDYHFNWVYSSMFSEDNETVFYKNYKELKKYNIDARQIIKNLPKMKIIDQISMPTKLKLVVIPPIQKLMLKFIPYQFSPNKKEKIPFYSKLYNDKHNKNFRNNRKI
ncbi:MAG: NACHT domain-containing protein [Haliscomenobacter sp.]|uniref:NACHT domain-containing protein n=1 Tax=Haliscomenobacter sp. TaxID=2717303 RepID=UPI0029B5C9AC|nr:NACHT domain-containing protein [Haliscomenobacter sp.]MDX2071859.1 NACHT domain-containing protein [Haliscomenobacter sp.]